MFFKKSAKSIIKQLSSAMVDSVDNIMDKVISIYTNTDEELLERATPGKILDFFMKNFDYPEKPLKYKHIRRISD